jgi:hypothetical protein
MEIKNALQIRKGDGKNLPKRGFNSFTQPIQFLPEKEKDMDWAQHNLDWLEWQGVKQISYNAKRLMKNYKLAKGTIDRSDYIPDEQYNDVSELIDTLSSDYVQSQDTDSAMELKFYPIIPNVINVLVAEFAKRNTKIDYRAIDEYSYNEIFEKKLADVEEALLEDAQGKLIEKMLQMGMDPNSEEAQQQLDPEALKRLPEIEEFYSKDYQTLGEQWAVKQHAIDVERFNMEELEEIAFRDMLITDREFWHFRMMEEDYDVELWNPVLTFYHKSPDVRYISEGSWVGKIDMLTVSDVIDKYGPILNKDELERLEALHPVRAGRYLLNGIQNDGSYYNPALDHDDNIDPSLQMKRWLSFNENAYNADDIVSWIIGESEHTGILHDHQMLRVTTTYWKSQRKVGYLTSINEGGEVFVDIVDEDYRIANNPIYHTKFKKKRNAETLVFGDHIEWIWINQVYGGVKIGPNRMMFQDTQDKDEFTPIYIGIDQNEVKPLRFQFKGDESLYGCKLPVEGKVFTERNTKSTALVDLMKPAQIGFNLVNNQIADILIDEIGTVIALDQNALPKHSLGEDWGKGNYAKAYVAMKDFSILPLDTSITNTENSLNFQHYQTLNLEQSNRLMSRVQMANFFKNQALEVIGMTPQRMGQQIGQTQTATEVEQSVVGSYAQTEMYFIQHSDYLMPRVHQMRTDLAQFYHSTKSSVRLQGLVSPDERKFFEINGIDLMLIDINVFCRTNANNRAVMEQIRQLAMQNNTSGATLYELAEVIESDSLGSLNNKLKEIENKAQQRAEQEHQRAKELQQQEAQAKQQEIQMENDHDTRITESKNRKDIMVAQIKAAGYGSMQDINENMQSDFKDAMDEIKASTEYQQTMDLKRTSETNKSDIANRKLDLENKKLEIEREKSQNQLKIARENQTKAEINAKKSQNKKPNK